MQQVFVRGLSAQGFHRLACYEWGRKDAPHTAICVHGLTRNARDFDRIAASLAENDYRVICVDVVGRGASDWLSDPAAYNYTQYLADMAGVLAYADADQVDWIGTSMGGLIGILLASMPQTPIRRIVLNDVGPLISEAAIGRIAEYVCNVPELSDRAAASAYLRAIYEKIGPCTDEDYTRMVEHSLRSLPSGGFGLNYDPAIATAFANIKGDVDLWANYDKITCPVLVLRGALSDVLTTDTANEMTQRGPRAQLITVPDIGHYPGLMDFAQIAAVKKFLAANPALEFRQ
jgi:pimeloyl-ACP methyl ester carboxylesterase